MIIRKKETKVELIQYLHRACYSPSNYTFIRAIKKKHFLTWPRLTVDLVLNHLLNSIATAQGHMKSEREGLRSTTRPPITSAIKFQDILTRY